MSKAFEKFFYDQIYAYTDSILSKIHCGFRKGDGTQYLINAMIKKWRRNLHQKGICRALFTDLNKAFECLVPEILTAKLDACGFTCESLKQKT